MKTIVPVHVYIGDGITDHRGNDRCTHCKLGADHACHNLPDVPADVLAEGARRAGEHDTEDRE